MSEEIFRANNTNEPPETKSLFFSCPIGRSRAEDPQARWNARERPEKISITERHDRERPRAHQGGHEHDRHVIGRARSCPFSVVPVVPGQKRYDRVHPWSHSRNNNPLSTHPQMLIPMQRVHFLQRLLPSANSNSTCTTRADSAPRGSKLPQSQPSRRSTVIPSLNSDSADSPPPSNSEEIPPSSNDDEEITIKKQTFGHEQHEDCLHSPLEPDHPALICMTRWFIFLTFRYRRDSSKISPCNDVGWDI